MEKKGVKFDEGKPPIALAPLDGLWEEAKVMGFGEKKYGTFNWTNGIGLIRLCSAAMRHIIQFVNGANNDKETGLSHLAHARCCLGMAIWMMNHKPKMDDRLSTIIKNESRDTK